MSFAPQLGSATLRVKTTKGMLVAARTLAMTAVDFFTDPEILETARREFLEPRGPDFVYRALLGDRKPPLDYRK